MRRGPAFRHFLVRPQSPCSSWSGSARVRPVPNPVPDSKAAGSIPAAGPVTGTTARGGPARAGRAVSGCRAARDARDAYRRFGDQLWAASGRTDFCQTANPNLTRKAVEKVKAAAATEANPSRRRNHLVSSGVDNRASHEKASNHDCDGGPHSLKGPSNEPRATACRHASAPSRISRSTWIATNPCIVSPRA